VVSLFAKSDRPLGTLRLDNVDDDWCPLFITHLLIHSQVLAVLRGLTADTRNTVVLFSGRPKADLDKWFASVVSDA
jgi:hypothetical protein